MNTCKDCKWWGGVIVGYEHRQCTNPKLDDDRSRSAPDSACPYASDDYGIGFGTGPDFGCVHWEAK